MNDKPIDIKNMHQKGRTRLSRKVRNRHLEAFRKLIDTNTNSEIPKSRFDKGEYLHEYHENTPKEGWRELYDAVYEFAPIGYYLLDQKGIIRETNLLGCQLFGSERKHLLGSTFSIWVDKASAEIYRQNYELFMKTGHCSLYELKLVKQNGTSFNASLESRGIIDLDGNPCCILNIVNDITEYTNERSKSNEMNIALKVLLKQREEDKVEAERNIISNLQRLINPYLDKLSQTSLTKDQTQYLNFIRTNLESVTSPFVKSLSAQYHSFTPREIEVANLIKSGRSTKEIAMMLSISRRSVEFHKDKIREKMGLKHQKINLQSYLMYSY